MKTWLQLRTEIKRECNIEGEEFVSNEELLAWVNDAKREVEAEIVSMRERYLEKELPLAATIGESLVTLPVDIFATKITGIYLANGSERYEVRPIRDKKEILSVADSDRYRYRIVNGADGLVMKFYPVIRSGDEEALTIFYIRKSVEVEEDNDYVDIPLAEGFVKQYIKDKVKEKELGPTHQGQLSPELEKQRSLLIQALGDQTPDDSTNELQPDTSFYDMLDYGDI